MNVELRRVVMLRVRGEHWALRLRGGAAPGDVRAFVGHAEALNFLLVATAETGSDAALRRLAADRWLRPCTLDRNDLLHTFARWMVDGTVVVSRRGLRPGNQPMVAEVEEIVVREAPPPPPVEQKTWIEVQLLDEDGLPVAGEPYWIRLPDGSVRQGRLDDRGLVRIEPLDPGECVVRWPSIDDASVVTPAVLTPVTARGGSASVTRGPIVAARTWIELELWDDDGNPVTGVGFHLEDAAGKSVDGTLDGRGRARVEDLAPGVCHVRFPTIDDDAWVPIDPAAEVA